MRSILAGWTLIGLLGASSLCVAAPKEFPYEAVVEGENIDVYSGPGRRYYPTSQLQRGDRVTVHREDPGGWCMISPPPGSYSLVRADDIEMTSKSQGVARANFLAVYAASTLSDRHDTEQVRLRKGQHVEVLGEATVDSAGFGKRRMLKIKPPTGEYRWVAGQYLAPAGSIAHGRHHADRVSDRREAPAPGSGPVHLEPKIVDDAPRPESNGPAIASSHDLVDRPVTKITHGGAIGTNGPTPDELLVQRNRLHELDLRFKEMTDGDPGHWSFRELEDGYRELRRDPAAESLASQVDTRIAAVERYRRIKSDYDDFIRLTTATSRRDEQLLSMQSGGGGPVMDGGPHGPSLEAPGPATAPVPDPIDAPPPSGSSIAPVPDEHMAGPVLGPPEAIDVPQSPAPPFGGGPQSPHRPEAPAPSAGGFPPAGPVGPDGRPPWMIGAGIIQRNQQSFPGAPQHILAAPNGRVLAYLQSGRPDLNLDNYLGQSLGVGGNRFRSRQAGGLVIQVTNMTPVRLAP